MKRYLLTLLLTSFLIRTANAQSRDTINFLSLEVTTCYKSSNNIKPEDVIFKLGHQAIDKIELVIKFPDKAQAKEAEKKVILLNITADNKKLTGKANEEYLVFNLDQPLQGANSVFLQIVSTSDNKCYQIIEENKVEKEENSSNAALPPLNLTPYTLNCDPCNSCSPIGNKIIYDFSENSLKNLKTKSSSDRIVNIDYLGNRWTKLPKVGEEMVFEIQNVNPFKFDITLKDEPVNISPDVPAFLPSAFIPKLPSASTGSNNIDSNKVNANRITQALKYLDIAISKKIEELRNAGDCFNPCSYIQSSILQVNDYFKDNFKYDISISLESFLSSQINSLISDSKDKEVLNAIVAKFYSFRNSASGNFSYRIPQIKNVDQYLFNLTIAPKPNILTGARVQNQDITVDILGGFKVDVTTGLFVTRLTDYKYQIRGDSTVISTVSGYSDSIVYNRRKKIFAEDYGNNDFGVASMFHFYPKLTPNLNVSFSLGAGVTLNDKPKLRYLTGGSILLGKTNRLAFTYGLMFGFVDRLSGKYDGLRDANGNVYTSYSEDKVEYKKIFKGKTFLSLTYSIPLFKKKEEVKSATSTAATEEPKAENDDKKATNVDDKK